MLILIAGLGVYGFGTSNPAVFGHSAEEIAAGTIGGVLTITNNRVGIGTTSPLSPLTVVGEISATQFSKSGCVSGFTDYGVCVSNGFYLRDDQIGDFFLASAISGNTFLGRQVDEHVCTRSEIAAACRYGNSKGWATPPSGYTFLLGDSCGDDCQLYVNNPDQCAGSPAGYVFNFDGPINPHQVAKWAARICY